MFLELLRNRYEDFYWLIHRRSRTIFQQKGGDRGKKIKYYHVLKVDTWSLQLLWHPSDINAICNFWPLLQILQGGAADPSDPAILNTAMSRNHLPLRATRMLYTATQSGDTGLTILFAETDSVNNCLWQPISSSCCPRQGQFRWRSCVSAS